MNKKGFMLAEAVITTAVVMVSFIFLYSQFISSYNESLRYSSYNNMEKLYLVHSFASYISEQTGVYNEWAHTLNSTAYIDVVDYCKTNVTAGSNRNQACLSILDKIGVDTKSNKPVLFVKNNATAIKNASGSNFSLSMNNFIKHLPTNSSDNNYRLIIQFSDGNFGSIKINRE